MPVSEVSLSLATASSIETVRTLARRNNVSETYLVAGTFVVVWFALSMLMYMLALLRMMVAGVIVLVVVRIVGGWLTRDNTRDDTHLDVVKT